VEILGVAFCGPCARQQEAYFAIGDLLDEEGLDFRGKALVEALEGIRRLRTGSKGEIVGGIYNRLFDIDKGRPLAFRRG
jgi:hypothetical protein